MFEQKHLPGWLLDFADPDSPVFIALEKRLRDNEVRKIKRVCLHYHYICAQLLLDHAIRAACSYGTKRFEVLLQCKNDNDTALVSVTRADEVSDL